MKGVKCNYDTSCGPSKRVTFYGKSYLLSRLICIAFDNKEHTDDNGNIHVLYNTNGTSNIYSNYADWETDYLQGKHDIEPHQLQIVTPLENIRRQHQKLIQSTKKNCASKHLICTFNKKTNVNEEVIGFSETARKYKMCFNTLRKYLCGEKTHPQYNFTYLQPTIEKKNEDWKCITKKHIQIYNLNANWKLQHITKLNEEDDIRDTLEDDTQSITYKGYRYHYIKEKGWRTFLFKSEKKEDMLTHEISHVDKDGNPKLYTYYNKK